MVLARRTFLLGACLLTSSCSSSSENTEDPNAPKVYVGQVDGTDMRVGFVTERGAAALFFCGGATTLDNTKWFRIPSADPSKFDFQKEGWDANGSATDSLASGNVTLKNGDTFAWHASRVPAGSVAGLYDYKGSDGVGGVVVISEDYAQGAFITAGILKVLQIVIVRPVRPEEDSLSVTVDTKPLSVARVHPAPAQ